MSSLPKKQKVISTDLTNTSTIKFTINVTPKTKKNSQQIVIVHNRPIIIPSKYYKQYEKDCAVFLPKFDKPINYPINLKCIFYMERRYKVDLSNLEEAICDILVHYGILEDDNRNIVATMDGSKVLWDKENSRTEIENTKLSDNQQW